jgi:hypothetical protein
LVDQGLLVHRVSVDQVDQQEKQEALVQEERQGLLDQVALLENGERLVSQVLVDHVVLQGLLVRVEREEVLVLLVNQDKEANKDKEVSFNQELKFQLVASDNVWINKHSTNIGNVCLLNCFPYYEL